MNFTRSYSSLKQPRILQGEKRYGNWANTAPTANIYEKQCLNFLDFKSDVNETLQFYCT